MKRSITAEKEFQLESLARDLLTELNALKNTVPSIEATHGKQVKAVHESYKRMLGLRPAEDKSKSEAMKVTMDGKVIITRPHHASSVLHARKSRTRCTSSRRTSSSCAAPRRGQWESRWITRGGEEAQAGQHVMGRRRRAHHDVDAHQDGQVVEGLRRVVGGYISVPPGPRSGGSDRGSRTAGPD